MVEAAGGIHPALLKAYRETCYETAGIAVRVGRRCAAMDRLLLSHRVRTAVFITAFNPMSRVMPPGWNRRMQASLLTAVRRRRPMLPARGHLRHWSEDHVLVFGDPRPMIRLARRYRQNAIVIVGRGQRPQVVVTSPLSRRPKSSGRGGICVGGTAEAGLIPGFRSI